MINGTTQIHTILPVSEMIKENWKLKDLKTDYSFNWLQRLWLKHIKARKLKVEG